jgi:hypothetical protein
MRHMELLPAATQPVVSDLPDDIMAQGRRKSKEDAGRHRLFIWRPVYCGMQLVMLFRVAVQGVAANLMRSIRN